jgi:GTP-binding protein HflX
VRDLPHELIAAFRSTLQEAREADLILHVIDASDPNRWQRVRQVNAVLKQLDADRVPQIRVYNKIDRLQSEPRLSKLRQGSGRAVWLSATTGEGIPLLLESIRGRLRRKKVCGLIRLGPSQGRQRALLFDMGAVTHEKIADDGGWILEFEVVERDLRRFLKREKLSADILRQSPVARPENAAIQR